MLIKTANGYREWLNGMSQDEYVARLTWETLTHAGVELQPEQSAEVYTEPREVDTMDWQQHCRIVNRLSEKVGLEYRERPVADKETGEFYYSEHNIPYLAVWRGLGGVVTH